MGKLSKFENVDVIASLEAIMKQNTAFYQSDFEIDKRILREAASRPANVLLIGLIFVTAISPQAPP